MIQVAIATNTINANKIVYADGSLKPPFSLGSAGAGTACSLISGPPSADCAVLPDCCHPCNCDALPTCGAVCLRARRPTEFGADEAQAARVQGQDALPGLLRAPRGRKSVGILVPQQPTTKGE